MNADLNKTPVRRQLDWLPMAVPFFFIVILCLCFVAFPEASRDALAAVRSFLDEVFGTWYLAVGLGIFLFSLYLAFSRYGSLRLGKPDEQPKSSGFAWGSMMFTSGLENICPPCTSDGKDYPMHGRIRTTPAEHVCSDAYWEGDRYVMTVSGEMREAELFGENMVLRRKITTVFPGKSIVLEDAIENQSFRREPMMLLYHCNVGWPLLGEDCEIVLPTRNVIPRDADAAPHAEHYNHMEAPLDNEPEYVFLHELAADENGETFAAVINPTQNLGIRISFNVRELSYFMEWKSRASGDYVIGLEPANSSVYGRLYHEERGDLHMMEPQSVETKKLVFTFLGGKELDAVKEEARRLVEKR